MKFSEWLDFKHPNLIEGLGKKVDGKYKPITPYAGSWADRNNNKTDNNTPPTPVKKKPKM